MCRIACVGWMALAGAGEGRLWWRDVCIGVICHGAGMEETSRRDRSRGSRSRSGSRDKSRRRRGSGSGSAGGGHFPCPGGCWRPPDEGRVGPLIVVSAL
jgi:hypothetical protein